MNGADINWARWFLFALVGTPLLLWLVMTRDTVMRALAVLAIVIFVQDTFVFRRYIVAFGIGPSLITSYVAVAGLYFHRGRFPRLGAAGLFWMLFLIAVAAAVIAGSVGTGLLFFNLHLYQEYYLEGLLFFVFGMMALSEDREIPRFFFWFSILIAFGVTLVHFFEIATGWRPAVVAAQVAVSGHTGMLETPGAVFPNPNTLGSFYVMTMPLVLIQRLRGGTTGWRRAALTAAFGAMSMSLIMTSARGGMIFTTMLCAIALLLAGFSVARVLSAGVALALILGISWLGASLLLPDFFHRITGQLQEEGLRTDRFKTFWTFATIALDHPLGLGLDLDTVKALRMEYRTHLGSAHNIYIDRAVQTGIFGLVAFLALVGHIVLRNLRAIRLPKLDPERRRALTYVLLPVIGFLAAGIVEPVYDIGCKLTLLFWFVCGMSYTASSRALTEFSAGSAPAAAPRREPWRTPRLQTVERAPARR